MIWVLLLFVLVAIALGLRSRALVQAAWYEGYRRGVKDCVQIAEDFGDDELRCAPAGEQLASVMRATIAHNIGLKLRDLTQRIGRTV